MVHCLISERPISECPISERTISECPDLRTKLLRMRNWSEWYLSPNDFSPNVLGPNAKYVRKMILLSEKFSSESPWSACEKSTKNDTFSERFSSECLWTECEICLKVTKNLPRSHYCCGAVSFEQSRSSSENYTRNCFLVLYLCQLMTVLYF
jgi:hypothetical protein